MAMTLQDHAYNLDDTIVAVATANGRGGIGIIRLSGPKACEIAERLTQKKLPKPRMAAFRRFYTVEITATEADSSALQPQKATTIDEGLVLYFPAGHSYTGDEVVELQGHGSPVALAGLVASCIRCGARMAQAGEFTYRAYMAGVLDLAQAESVADLINAESLSAVKSAASSLRGEFSRRVDAVSDGLIDMRTLIESGLDFSEEEIDWISHDEQKQRLLEIMIEIQTLQATAHNGVLLREGVKMVLVGAPNVGKSSLMNALMGEEVAIVTDIAGTTRDAITRTVLIEGIPFMVVDTAGLREADDPLEKLGIERTLKEIRLADMIMILRCCEGGDGQPCRVSQVEDATLQMIEDNRPDNCHVLEVVNKVDLWGDAINVADINNPHPSRYEALLSQAISNHLTDERGNTPSPLFISVKKQHGLDHLKKTMLEAIGWHGQSQESIFIARTRHLEALRQCYGHLETANDYLVGMEEGAFTPAELLAEELRLAHMALQSITGEFGVEDLLGEIFGKFCIGK